MNTIYEIYADQHLICKGEDYEGVKEFWDEIVSTPYLAAGADYKMMKNAAVVEIYNGVTK